MLKKTKQVQFFEETFTAWEGCRYDGWIQLELESGEIVSIPGNYFKRKCKKCGNIEKSYGLNGLCQKCERGENMKTITITAIEQAQYLLDIKDDKFRYGTVSLYCFEDGKIQDTDGDYMFGDLELPEKAKPITFISDFHGDIYFSPKNCSVEQLIQYIGLTDKTLSFENVGK